MKEVYRAKFNGKYYYFETNYGGWRKSIQVAQELGIENFKLRIVKVSEDTIVTM